MKKSIKKILYACHEAIRGLKGGRGEAEVHFHTLIEQEAG